MKNLTFLSVLLLSMVSFVNANILPVEVGFKMVKCPVMLCARVKVNMDPATYQALGEPTSATFKYHKLVGQALPPEYTMNDTIYYNHKYSNSAVTIDEDHASLTAKGHSFMLTRFCLGGKSFCADIQITADSSTDKWKYQSLTFPMPNNETITVSVGFKMVKCGSFFANRCASAAVKMDKKTYDALGPDTPVKYTYYKRIDPPLLSAKFVKTSDKDEWIIIKTDLNNRSKMNEHHSFYLNQVCLANIGCVETSISAYSADDVIENKTLYFPIPEE